MGWGSPDLRWRALEARLRGQVLPGADGNDAPAFSRRRSPYVPSVRPRGRSSVPHAELHCHSNFSFLDGASAPEALVEEAVRLGIETLALTDHDGMYGVVRFAQAARTLGVGTVIGAELTLEVDGPANGVPDPPGTHLMVLARDAEGYARLCRTIAQAQLAGEKGAPRYAPIEEIGAQAAGRWLVLTGCRKGAVPAALLAHGPSAARQQLRRLIVAFGRGNVAVELWDHGDPLDGHRNDALARLAVAESVEVVVTNNVHYARPSEHRTAAAMAAIRSRRSLSGIDGWLPVSAGAHLRTGDEQTARFRRFPGVVERTAALGRQLALDLRLVAPRLPGFPVPDGHSPMSWLRRLVAEGAERRYGPRVSESVDGAWAQIDHELRVIEALGYPGYFLIVHDIVSFCRAHDILCQGRGSAANSAVCFVLGITNADAVRLGLLFERFLSAEREGPPDIDLDIESSRREEVIQYVYERYGREHAAQVANVVTYRARSAIRDAGRVLGHARGTLDAWAQQVSSWSRTLEHRGDRAADDVGGRGSGTGSRDGSMTSSADDSDVAGIPDDVVDLAADLLGSPRHLGIHSGGMVLCDRPIVEVCPVEHARMEGRTVLQWDKDDCAAVGLVKFDLLGLGMLSAIHETVDLVAAHHGVEIDLGALPQEEAVYDMLCRADAVGVFQVESRAQLSTLPRLRPRTFYDLVVEVALIRPGPIQGGSVHPYLRRRNGLEEVTYPHPLLRPALERTLGVPLFQEQLMQMAVDAAGLSAAEADQLRQAMGAKRSTERMEGLRQRLYDGMADRGIPSATADAVYAQIAAFADYGFPESHAVSFAYLVYASAWLKLHHPAAFLAGLLNHQPMGFYAPQSLVADARRHGVRVHRPHVDHSAARAVLEADDASTGGMAVRLGLTQVRDVGEDLAERIAVNAPYRSVEDLARRTGAHRRALESLASSGACHELAGGRTDDGTDRRRALWVAGAVAGQDLARLVGTATGAVPPALPSMSEAEVTWADLRTTGVSTQSHPMTHLRGSLADAGVVPADGLAEVAHGRRVHVAGVVTHRQQPATAGGTVFVNLEDETGMVNVICAPGVWTAFRRVALTSAALVVTGRLERAGGATNLIARRLAPLPVAVPVRARDFR